MDTDYDSIQHTQSITQKFFTIPSKTDPSILKVINEIKKRNNNKEFITAFVKQHGYPVWNKVLIGKNIKPRYENSFTNAVNDSSIIAYIPYVLEDSTKINGYIVASISDSITLGYRQANEYVNHSFDAPVNGVSDATKFATVMMQLNQLVFGNNEYYITDRRLFGSTTEHIEINKVKLGATEGGVLSQNFAEAEICSTVTTSGWQCGTPNYHGCNDADGCDHCITYCYPVDIISEVCWTFEVGDGGGGETGTGTAPGGNAPPPPGSGGGGSGSGIPPADPCNSTPDNPTNPYTAQSNIVDPGNCPPPTGGPGWVPWEDEPTYIDVISDPNAPSYPDISDNEPQISLQSLFNCFSQIPDAGATYSVKLCVDLPVNAVWNAPFNLTHKSPGHTFLTLTKTNGTQSISQTVGFYPIGSGGNPINPNATGGFKNNGRPVHEYNAAVNAYNVTASQFSMVMNNLLSHENDTYNIFDNNCTTIALNAFNLLIHPKIMVEPFVVQVPTTPPQTPYFFMQSPQKLYKAIETFQAGFGLSKEFNVNSDSPLSNTCP